MGRFGNIAISARDLVWLPFPKSIWVIILLTMHQALSQSIVERVRGEHEGMVEVLSLQGKCTNGTCM